MNTPLGLSAVLVTSVLLVIGALIVGFVVLRCVRSRQMVALIDSEVEELFDVVDEDGSGEINLAETGSPILEGMTLRRPFVCLCQFLPDLANSLPL